MNLVCFAYSASAIFLFLIDSLTIIIFLISEFDNEDINFIVSISSLENDFIKSIISSLSFPDKSCINTLHFRDTVTLHVGIIKLAADERR